ncbi:hypothetical protein SAMN04488514_103168 [Kriegella aquimaris]|uniref:Uncharacterized protein n=1 Tax=Kriegella aquimaris TaxID=192904 RepID=A0A1G9NG94_9FLAO|nr:hypothetical protein SAMN04488514_103168 [Kriegella aquimaris]
MEKIYSQHENRCQLVATRTETIQFLLNYSKSLHIVEHKNFKFENILN